MMIDNCMKQSEKFVSEFRLSKTAKGQLLPKAINLLQLGLTHMRKKNKPCASLLWLMLPTWQLSSAVGIW